MRREIKIISYFSLSTNVAGELSGWPEFVAGDGYTVDLAETASSETVNVRLIKQPEAQYVAVNGTRSSTLFAQVLGRLYLPYRPIATI